MTANWQPEPAGTAGPPVVRLSGPDDLIGAVPAMLGFHPTESLVLCCLQGPRCRQCLTMRVDLPAAGHRSAVSAGLAVRARAAGADRALLLVYTERGDGPAHPELVATLARALAAEGVELADAYRVGRGRWWSYLCGERDCCPAQGSPLPGRPGAGALQYLAEVVAAGGQVHPDRAALQASVAAPAGGVRVRLRRARGPAAEQLREVVVAGGAEALRAHTGQLLGELADRYAGGRGGISDDEAARACLGLHDVGARDELLARSVARPAARLAMLHDLVRLAVPPDDAPACAALAAVAYLHGDGALARCALDRALDSDPGYSLALLLDHALARALPPTVLAEAFTPGLPAGAGRGVGGRRSG